MPRLATTMLLVGLTAGTVTGALPVAAFASSRTTSSPSLAGVTITFGDQLKEYQTIFKATNALAGAAYTVNWANFIGGPPVIAAETSGSVDLGDMAETPVIFAQAAGDPVKVVATTVGTSTTKSPLGIVVPAGSPIKSVAQLKGHTVAIQEGTVEQYYLVQALSAHVPYGAVTLDNLAVTTASTAVTNGQVDAAVIRQPLIALDETTGKVRQISSGAGIVQTLGYLTASDAALANPQKKAAIADFIGRFYKAEAILAKDPALAAQTYSKTYGITLAGGRAGRRLGAGQGIPDHAGDLNYQQNEANTFRSWVSSRPTST